MVELVKEFNGFDFQFNDDKLFFSTQRNNSTYIIKYFNLNDTNIQFELPLSSKFGFLISVHNSELILNAPDENVSWRISSGKINKSEGLIKKFHDNYVLKSIYESQRGKKLIIENEKKKIHNERYFPIGSKVLGTSVGFVISKVANKKELYLINYEDLGIIKIDITEIFQICKIELPENFEIFDVIPLESNKIFVHISDFVIGCIDVRNNKVLWARNISNELGSILNDFNLSLGNHTPFNWFYHKELNKVLLFSRNYLISINLDTLVSNIECKMDQISVTNAVLIKTHLYFVGRAENKGIVSNSIGKFKLESNRLEWIYSDPKQLFIGFPTVYKGFIAVKGPRGKIFLFKEL